MKNLQGTIEQFQARWKMTFEEFKKMPACPSFEKDAYSYDIEQDFWQWKEAETFKKHYESLKKEWM